ncbi:Mss4-like protein [Leucosporidium creatinivorum]|uniref:Mss4-like protein n=1 Tax=Leucosporidium creatinivorum TaxID=106004 RepID=A0A1Y2D6F2_9BASI|nr:Mss4-like protein [Leucosporidium creatinivorum]
MTDNGPLKGSCFCEAVAYELSVPLSEIVSRGCFCNCRTCQKLFGDRSFDVALQLSDFKVTKGSPSSFSDTQTASGKAMIRYFCSDCGSSIYTTSDARPGRVWVKVGTLDRASEFRPDSEIYVDSGIPSISLEQDLTKSIKHYKGMDKEVHY